MLIHPQRHSDLTQKYDRISIGSVERDRCSYRTSVVFPSGCSERSLLVNPAKRLCPRRAPQMPVKRRSAQLHPMGGTTAGLQRRRYATQQTALALKALQTGQTPQALQALPSCPPWRSLWTCRLAGQDTESVSPQALTNARMVNPFTTERREYGGLARLKIPARRADNRFESVPDVSAVMHVDGASVITAVLHFASRSSHPSSSS
jgi:hypothetical protein